MVLNEFEYNKIVIGKDGRLEEIIEEEVEEEEIEDDDDDMLSNLNSENLDRIETDFESAKLALIGQEAVDA